MAIWCPRREQRRELEICQKLCPKTWEKNLEVKSDGAFECKLKTLRERRLEKRKEMKK